MAQNLKNWKDSASLLLVGKQKFLGSKQTDPVNYKILTMKRSSKSSFFPNTHVFPGGILEKEDCSPDWLKLFKKFGMTEKHFDVFKKLKHVTPIYKNGNTNPIPRYISLRICAIRETFEECGVLLCKNSKENNGNISTWASCFADIDVNEWQKRVHSDESQFIELCYKYNIYPDIWALHEWSNWLAPSEMPIRFDTIFFLANISKIVPTFAERKEVQNTQWDSPIEILEKNDKLEILLPPPQFYELSRLAKFSTIEELAEFSRNRCSNGSEQMFPYRLDTDTIQTSILPGDDLYPGEENAQIPYDHIMNDIPEMNHVHRMYHVDSHKYKLSMKNYKPKVEHVDPILTMDFKNT